MNLIFRTVRLENFMTSCKDKLYHYAISNKLKFNFLIIVLQQISAFVWHWVRNRKNNWLQKIRLVTIHSWTDKIKSSSCLWQELSDLPSSSDVTTNDVNGRIGNKTWWKGECCAPMETSKEGVCCLEITEICKERFSSRFSSCLNVCRSDPYFILWYSRREIFVSYLISIQCWSLANQNKSFLSLQTSWLSFSVKHFTLLIRSFSL